jgi:hypothetical protein
MPRLPHIANNMANRSLHMKISLKTFMIALLSSPFSTNRQKSHKKRRAKSAKANSSNQWPNALSKWLTTDINTFSRLLTQTHPGSTHAASILFLPRANRPWHSFFTRALHYLSGGGTKLKSSAG